MQVTDPSAAGLRQARRRVGPRRCGHCLTCYAALRPAVRWRGLLVCAIDGTTISVPDSTANVTAFGRQTGHHGGTVHQQPLPVAEGGIIDGAAVPPERASPVGGRLDARSRPLCG
jgi:hypothetical protein